MVLSLRPCCSARALEVLIFLLFILDAHFLFQVARSRLTAARTPLIVGKELSEEAPGDGLLAPSVPSRLWVGLDGRGEKVPWLQGPSCTCSRISITPLSNDVDSVGA